MPSGIHATPLDWLLKTSDHNPQIIGTFPTLASTVNIQIWDVTDGQNILLSIQNSGCYAIGDTNRWGWSASYLPTDQGYIRHCFYLMTANTAETFGGQFLIEAPEGARWIHANNREDYIKQL